MNKCFAVDIEITIPRKRRIRQIVWANDAEEAKELAERLAIEDAPNFLSVKSKIAVNNREL